MFITDFKCKDSECFLIYKLFTNFFHKIIKINFFNKLLKFFNNKKGYDGVHSPVVIADSKPSIALPFDCTAKLMVFFDMCK